MHIESTPLRFDHVIHLGAGRCAELDACLAAEPGLLLLVEADPRLAETLAQRVAERPDVRVLQAVVAAQPGQATFHRYNLPDANGLYRATGLHELYPGLRLLEEVPVNTLGIAELLATLNLNPDQRNKLVIDIPGEEARLLETLAVEGQLHLFSDLDLVVGRIAMYEGGAPAKEILGWLAERGFDLVEEDPSEDPDQPRYHLRRNDLALEVIALRQRVENLNSELDAQIGVSADRATELQALQAVLDQATARVVELEDQLQSVTAERDKKAQQVNDLSARRDELENAVKAGQAELQECIPQLRIQAKLASERAEQLEAITANRDEQASQLVVLTDERDRLKSRIGDLQAKLDDAQRAAEEEAKRAGLLESRLTQSQQKIDADSKQSVVLSREIDRMTRAFDQASSRAEEMSRRIAEMESEKSESQLRQELLDQEMLRAAAQIDLLKDVLLNDVSH